MRPAAAHARTDTGQEQQVAHAPAWGKRADRFGRARADDSSLSWSHPALARSRVRDADVLRLGEEAQRLVAALAADAALLHAAERHAQVAQHPAVDPDGARVESARRAVGAASRFAVQIEAARP